MNAADRNRIVAMLLEVPPPSCRAVSRATGYSDWTIRKIAREVDGDPRPMRRPPSLPTEGSSALAGWIIFGGIAAFVALLFWARVRWMPPESWD